MSTYATWAPQRSRSPSSSVRTPWYMSSGTSRRPPGSTVLSTAAAAADPDANAAHAPAPGCSAVSAASSAWRVGFSARVYTHSARGWPPGSRTKVVEG